MTSPESEENLTFDYHTIRLIIGLIAVSFPLVVRVRAARITDSISWSYHTDARDWFVGFLFVIGAFLISYRGHKPVLDTKKTGAFWKWLDNFCNGAIALRIWERRHEEDLVSWVGGIAAVITAIYPTGRCLEADCPYDPMSRIHYVGAILLFSTTVYFCLVAFRSRAAAKMPRIDGPQKKTGTDPRRLRWWIYSCCGWGIVATMLGLVVLKSTPLQTSRNVTFWAETAALELFGVAWLVASQYLPVVTSEAERQKLF